MPAQAISRTYQLVDMPLSYICEREKMMASTSVLATLVERAGHDVRACLNTLQFMRAKTDRLTEEMMNGVAIGKKDAGK